MSLHFIVTAPGYDPIITHVFTPDSEYLSEDAVFGVKETLIADLSNAPQPQRDAEKDESGSRKKLAVYRHAPPPLA